MDLTENIYRMTTEFPAEEKWGLVAQMRRSAISVPSNIAEGYGRQATGDYRRYLSIARGSLLELETQLRLSKKLNFLKTKEADLVLQEISEISRMTATLLLKPQASCLKPQNLFRIIK